MEIFVLFGWMVSIFALYHPTLQPVPMYIMDTLFGVTMLYFTLRLFLRAFRGESSDKDPSGSDEAVGEDDGLGGEQEDNQNTGDSECSKDDSLGSGHDQGEGEEEKEEEEGVENDDKEQDHAETPSKAIPKGRSGRHRRGRPINRRVSQGANVDLAFNAEEQEEGSYSSLPYPSFLEWNALIMSIFRILTFQWVFAPAVNSSSNCDGENDVIEECEEQPCDIEEESSSSDCDQNEEVENSEYYDDSEDIQSGTESHEDDDDEEEEEEYEYEMDNGNGYDDDQEDQEATNSDYDYDDQEDSAECDLEDEEEYVNEEREQEEEEEDDEENCNTEGYGSRVPWKENFLVSEVEVCVRRLYSNIGCLRLTMDGEQAAKEMCFYIRNFVLDVRHIIKSHRNELDWLRKGESSFATQFQDTVHEDMTCSIDGGDRDFLTQSADSSTSTDLPSLDEDETVDPLCVNTEPMPSCTNCGSMSVIIEQMQQQQPCFTLPSESGDVRLSYVAPYNSEVISDSDDMADGNLPSVTLLSFRLPEWAESAFFMLAPNANDEDSTASYLPGFSRVCLLNTQSGLCYKTRGGLKGILGHQESIPNLLKLPFPASALSGSIIHLCAPTKWLTAMDLKVLVMGPMGTDTGLLRCRGHPDTPPKDDFGFTVLPSNPISSPWRYNTVETSECALVSFPSPNRRFYASAADNQKTVEPIHCGGGGGGDDSLCDTTPRGDEQESKMRETSLPRTRGEHPHEGYPKRSTEGQNDELRCSMFTPIPEDRTDNDDDDEMENQIRLQLCSSIPAGQDSIVVEEPKDPYGQGLMRLD